MKYLIILLVAFGIKFAQADTTYGKVVGTSSDLFVNISEDGEASVPQTIRGGKFLGTKSRFVTGIFSDNALEEDVPCGRMTPSIVGETTRDFVLVIMINGKARQAIVPAGSHYDYGCGWGFSGNISLR